MELDGRLLGIANNVVTAGQGNLTDIPVAVNITIPAGETYSFHIAVNGVGVNYTNGTGTGNVYASNTSLEFIEGHGGSGLFNCTFSLVFGMESFATRLPNTLM